jgi:hypothetical protein
MGAALRKIDRQTRGDGGANVLACLSSWPPLPLASFTVISGRIFRLSTISAAGICRPAEHGKELEPFAYNTAPLIGAHSAFARTALWRMKYR